MPLRIFLMITAFALNAAFFSPQAHVPSDQFLAPVSMSEEDRVRSQIEKFKDRGMDLERAKIEYLITRVRESPYVFIRNGDTHSGRIAAAHITNKYRKKAGLIRTATDFIRKCATRSSTTGRPYYIKLSSETAYPAAALLANELSFLEDCLGKTASV